MIEYTVKVDKDGNTFWYLNGELHREGGLPAVEGVDDYNAWWVNGKLHRVGAPAVERVSGTKKWYLNGLLHREDGPAIESVIDNYKTWYLNGVRYTEKEFNEKMNPVKELTVTEIEKLLGYKVKVIK